MNELTIFNNPDFGDIRTTTINGEPWLVGKDVAKALGYSNPQKAIRDHVDTEDRTVNESFTVNGTPITLINESGLYALILSSKLPKAKEFKHWVTAEVLPSIRKNGGYLSAAAAQEMMEAQKQIITRLERMERRQFPAAAATGGHTILYIPTKQEVERRRLMFRAVADLSGMTDMSCNSILHQLYMTLERTAKVSVSEYTERYRLETGNPSGSPLHMIAANDELYQRAKELLEDALNRFSVFK